MDRWVSSYSTEWRTVLNADGDCLTNNNNLMNRVKWRSQVNRRVKEPLIDNQSTRRGLSYISIANNLHRQRSVWSRTERVEYSYAQEQQVESKVIKQISDSSHAWKARSSTRQRITSVLTETPSMKWVDLFLGICLNYESKADLRKKEGVKLTYS